MRIAIIGATGETDRHFLKLAVDNGHAVTTLARNAAKLHDWRGRIEIVQADGRDREALAAALAEPFDCVVSIVGANGLLEARKVRDLYSKTTDNLLHALGGGSRRLVVVSSRGVEPQVNDNWFYVHVLKRFFLANMYADMLRMESLLEASAADFTIVRPPYLTSGEATGDYRVSRHRNFTDDRSLRRGDLAHFILHCVENPADFSRSMVALSE